MDECWTCKRPSSRLAQESHCSAKAFSAGPQLSAIRFGSEDELSQGGRLSFFVKTEVPEKFSHSEKIEVATADESFHILLERGRRQFDPAGFSDGTRDF